MAPDSGNTNVRYLGFPGGGPKLAAGTNARASPDDPCSEAGSAATLWPIVFFFTPDQFFLMTYWITEQQVQVSTLVARYRRLISPV